MKMFELVIFPGKFDKKDAIETKGGQAYVITGALNDEKNEHGQDIGLWRKQTDEERNAKAKKVYVGNGKVFWSNDSGVVPQDKKPEPEDDLPF